MEDRKAPPGGLEPPTLRVEAARAVQLRYEGKGYGYLNILVYLLSCYDHDDTIMDRRCTAGSRREQYDDLLERYAVWASRLAQGTFARFTSTLHG